MAEESGRDSHSRSRSNEYDDDERSKRPRDHGYSSYDEPQSKRSKHSNADRLSDPPESLITHIFSFMPITDAVKTDLLSKHWHHQQAWKSSQTIVFPERGSSPSSPRHSYYTRLINTTLALHNGPKIKKLALPEIEPTQWGRVSYELDPPIDLWVEAAVEKQVEELELAVSSCLGPYVLPPCLLSCNTLTKFSLDVKRIELARRSVICWKSLKKLTIMNVKNVDDDMIRRIIDGSPALESLSLLSCDGFDGFDKICVPCDSNLRNLVIDWYYNRCSEEHKLFEDIVDDFCLEISAPSVTTLEISGYRNDNPCQIKDISSSLVQVGLRFSMSTSVENHEGEPEICPAKLQKCQLMLLDMLRKVNHAENLLIGAWCTQVLSICELESLPSTILQCKSLELDTLYIKNLPGIARLLQCSPYLERLTIDLHRDYYFEEDEVLDELGNASKFSGFDGENYWKSLLEKGLSLRHLKVVTIKGFDNSQVENMLKLAQFLLRHAIVLEEFIFQLGKGVCDSDLRNARESEAIPKLLSYPKSSRQAKVLVKL